MKRDADEVVARGWVGIWRDGRLGWGVPAYIQHHYPAGRPRVHFEMKNTGPCMKATDPLVYCEIRIRPVRDSRGRWITRTLRGLRRMMHEEGA